MSALCAGGYAYDPEARTLRYGERAVRLAPTPGVVLAMLLRRTGAVVTHDAIMSRLYDHRPDPACDTMTVVVVCLLRRCIAALGGPPLIETVWGRGYMVRAESGVTRLLSADQAAALDELIAAAQAWRPDLAARVRGAA